MKTILFLFIITFFLPFNQNTLNAQSKEFFTCVLQKDTFSFALKRADFGSQDSLLLPLKYHYKNLKNPKEITITKR